MANSFTEVWGGAQWEIKIGAVLISKHGNESRLEVVASRA